MSTNNSNMFNNGNGNGKRLIRVNTEASTTRVE